MTIFNRVDTFVIYCTKYVYIMPVGYTLGRGGGKVQWMHHRNMGYFYEGAWAKLY